MASTPGTTATRAPLSGSGRVPQAQAVPRQRHAVAQRERHLAGHVGHRRADALRSTLPQPQRSGPRSKAAPRRSPPGAGGGGGVEISR